MTDLPNVDLEAERAVLASWLAAPSCLADALSLVTPGQYWSDLHRRVWEALEWLHGQGRDTDAVTVARVVAQRNGAELGGQAVKLFTELSYWPTVSDVRAHAGRVAECADARRLALALREALHLVDSGEATTAVAKLTAELNRERQTSARVLSEADVMAAGMRSITRSRSGVYCTSGNATIDHLTGGISEGCTWLFGAQRNFGKSAWCLRISEENQLRGMVPLIVSNEDDEALVGKRLISMRTEIPLEELRGAGITGLTLARVVEAVESARHDPLVLDSRGRCIEDVCRDVDQLIRTRGVKLVIWDYLQSFRCRESFKDNERMRVRHCAELMRRTTQLHRVAGVILSQLTSMTGKTYPDGDSIRDCRDVSDAAEVIIIGFELKEQATILHRGREQTYDEGQRILFVDKNKDGPKKLRIPVEWNEKLATFETDVRESREIDELDRFSEPG